MSDVPERVMPPPELKLCMVCRRHFLQERIKAHEAICHASSSIKRKPFNVTEQILKGSDAGKPEKGYEQDCQTSAQKSKRSGLNTNWRRKHEEFLRMIREAKQETEKSHTNVLSESSDLRHDENIVRCHYCFRPYNKMAASRHMAICAWKTTNDYSANKHI